MIHRDTFLTVAFAAALIAGAPGVPLNADLDRAPLHRPRMRRLD